MTSCANGIGRLGRRRLDEVELRERVGEMRK